MEMREEYERAIIGYAEWYVTLHYIKYSQVDFRYYWGYMILVFNLEPISKTF